VAAVLPRCLPAADGPLTLTLPAAADTPGLSRRV